METDAESQFGQKCKEIYHPGKGIYRPPCQYNEQSDVSGNRETLKKHPKSTVEMVPHLKQGVAYFESIPNFLRENW